MSPALDQNPTSAPAASRAFHGRGVVPHLGWRRYINACGPNSSCVGANSRPCFRSTTRRLPESSVQNTRVAVRWSPRAPFALDGDYAFGKRVLSTSWSRLARASREGSRPDRWQAFAVPEAAFSAGDFGGELGKCLGVVRTKELSKTLSVAVGLRLKLVRAATGSV